MPMRLLSRWLGRSGAAPHRRAQTSAERETMGATYPGDSDTGHDWRRWEPTARLMALGFFASMGLNIALGGVLMALFPLKQLEWGLVTILPEGHAVAEIRSLREDRDALASVVMGWAETYVDYRQGIVPTDKGMADRILWIAKRSETAIYREFEQLDKPVIMKGLKDGTTRAVTNRTVSSPAPNVVMVDFTLLDTVKGVTTPKGRFRATLRYELRRRITTRDELRSEADPASFSFGFTVVQYDLGQI